MACTPTARPTRSTWCTSRPRGRGPSSAPAPEDFPAFGRPVLAPADGTVVHAHLRRGSLRVAKGQRVAAGEQVAACGNSGNSTEPHLHFQVMDHPSVLFAAGLPFRLARYDVDGRAEAGVPANGRPFTVGAPDRAAEDRR